MTELTDELLRRRLAERTTGPSPSLATLARTATDGAQLAPVPAWPRRLLAGSALAGAAVVVIGLVVGARGVVPTPGPSGGAAGSFGGATPPGTVAPSVSGPGSILWTGLEWAAGSAEAFASDETLVNDVVAVGDGFVAVGTRQVGTDRAGTVWRSADGHTWTAMLVPWGDAVVPQRVVATGDGLAIVAVVRSADGDGTPAQLWTSRDGTAWTRGPDLPDGANGDRTAAGPGAVLTVVTDADGRSRMARLASGTATWAMAGDWPAGTALGAPAWTGSEWVLPGTTAATASGQSQAAVWTSGDGSSWSTSAVEEPDGGLFRILPAADGLLGLGTAESVCGGCYGPVIFQDAFWTSPDGRTWHRLPGDPLGLPRGAGTGYRSDGQRIVAIAPSASAIDASPRIWVTTDGRSWTALRAAATGPDGVGDIGVGPSGVALLPSVGGTRRPWFGSAIVMDGAEPSDRPEPAPLTRAISGCEARHFSLIRCSAIAARAIEQAAGGEPVSVEVGPPDQDTVSLGSTSIAKVSLRYADGSVRSTDIRCFLVSGWGSDRVCSDDPQLEVSTGVSTDIPCGPNPGDDRHPCVPPPTPRPASIEASEPLVVRAVDVPIDRVGHYEVEVGAASLPDGAISQRDGTVGDPRPTGFWIDGAIDIQVRSDIPGRPIADSFNRDRYDGPEPVHVYLVFDVTELTGGGTLEIRNLVVS